MLRRYSDALALARCFSVRVNFHKFSPASSGDKRPAVACDFQVSGERLIVMTGVSYRVTVSRLWVLTIMMEHLVLILRWSLGSFLPTVPQWLETAKDTLKFKTYVHNSDPAVALVLVWVYTFGPGHYCC